VTDAVLTAIEALRHHALHHLYLAIEESREEREEHANPEHGRATRLPTALVTPFGNVEIGGPLVLNYEPAWVGAREAARHARLAVGERSGSEAEATERAWQAERLAQVLAPV
jgi:hypothetical protein